MAGRAYSTEAVVLRSIRFGEADRVLHLYTEAHGRVGAVAKGVRKTMSRFGARLEPLSHVELVLHRGRGELETVTAAQLVRSHREAREDYYRFSVGMIGAEAMLRLFSEEEANERAFTALVRFLDLLDDHSLRASHDTLHASDSPSLDPLGLAFQLKLLWLSGYLPHVSACAECGAEGDPLVGYSTRAGGAVCGRCAPATEALALAAGGIVGIESLLAHPLAEAAGLGLSESALRDALRVVTASYEYHGGFRLRTLARRSA
jgi:DNA repair protein RecO (recombination protein O)